MSALRRESIWQQAIKPPHERPDFRIIEGGSNDGSEVEGIHGIIISAGVGAVAATIDIGDFVNALNDPRHKSFREEALEYHRQLVADGRSS